MNNINSLSLCFGATLKYLRKSHKIEINDFLSEFDIRTSYYRNIESGVSNLHINKAVELYHTLDEHGISVSYQGLVKVLLGIHYINTFILCDDAKTYKREKEWLLEEIQTIEPELAEIFTILDEHKLFGEIKEDKLVFLKRKIVLEKLNLLGITQRIRNMIVSFEEKGEIETFLLQKTETDIPSVNKRINHIPAFRVEHLLNSVNMLKEMSAEVNLDKLLEWEDEFKNGITSLSVIIDNPLQILEMKESKKYCYRYLEEDSFEEMQVLILNNASEKSTPELLAIFINNIIHARSTDNINFDEEDLREAVKKKVKFKILDNKQSRLKAIELLEKGQSLLDENRFNAIWSFKILEDIDVSFRLSKNSNKKDCLVHGVPLNFEQSYHFKQSFDELLRTMDSTTPHISGLKQKAEIENRYQFTIAMSDDEISFLKGAVPDFSEIVL